MRIQSLSTDFQASRGLEGEAGVNTGQKITQALACLALHHRKPPVKLPGWIFIFGWTIPLIKYAKWQQQLSAVASQLINANIMSWLKLSHRLKHTFTQNTGSQLVVLTLRKTHNQLSRKTGTSLWNLLSVRLIVFSWGGTSQVQPVAPDQRRWSRS